MYDGIRLLNRSWPAVSHSCSRIYKFTAITFINYIVLHNKHSSQDLTATLPNLDQDQYFCRAITENECE